MLREVQSSQTQLDFSDLVKYGRTQSNMWHPIKFIT